MFEDFEVNPEHVPAVKLGLHIFQLVIAFILWCIEIAVFRNSDSIVNGQVGWTFAVVCPVGGGKLGKGIKS